MDIVKHLVKIIEAVMPTTTSKIIAPLGLLAAFSMPLWHGAIGNRFGLNLWQADAVIAISALIVLLLSLLICLVSIGKANYRLIEVRDRLIEEGNEKAAFFSMQSNQIKELERSLASTRSDLYSLRKEYQAFNNRYDELLVVCKKLIGQIEAAGLKPIVRPLCDG